MTRTFSDRHPKVLPACNFLPQYYFYNIFLQKSCRFSLQTLTKFEAAKTGSGVGFLRLTAVCLWLGLPSTLTCHEHELLENALQSGGIWKHRLCVLLWSQNSTREFQQWRRRQRGGRLVKKMYLYFTFECRNTVNLFSTPIGLKICSG